MVKYCISIETSTKLKRLGFKRTKLVLDQIIEWLMIEKGIDLILKCSVIITMDFETIMNIELDKLLQM